LKISDREERYKKEKEGALIAKRAEGGGLELDPNETTAK
jgi:hypothetical protein